MINNITNKTKNKDVDISDYLQDEIKHNTIEQTVTTTHKNISNYINIVDMLNNKALIDTLHVFNPASLYKKTYLPLDSRNTYANTNYKLSWYITNSQNIRTGFINVRNKLRDIVCIRLMNCFIYSPFIFIRQISIPDTRQNYSTKRLAFYINDFGANAATSVSGINYHFLGIVNERKIRQNSLDPATLVLAYRLNMEEQFNFGKYEFHKPVNLFDQITLSMSDLDYQIPLSGSITIDNCVVTSVTPEGGTTFTIRVTTKDFYYPFISQDIYNAYAPDVTTTDPITDAAWIASVRSTNHILWYAPTTPIVALFNTTTGSLPIGTVSLTFIRIDIVTSLTAELEVTYIDSS